MISKRHLLIGLLTVIVTCVAVMYCLPTDGLLKAVPLTLVILCLAIKRFYAQWMMKTMMTTHL